MVTTKTYQDLVTFADRQDDACKLRLMRKASHRFWRLIWLLIIIVIIITIIINIIAIKPIIIIAFLGLDSG